MTEPDGQADAGVHDHGARFRLAEQLRVTIRELVAARAPGDPAVAAAKRRVRAFQNRRFAATYTDLGAQRRYAPAVEFFLSELYGEGDMSRRDADIERVVPAMIRILPVPALETVAEALAFEALSERLDAGVARAIRDAPLDVERYAEGFRACGERPARMRQIAYVGEVGHALDRLTRMPMVGTTLKLMRAPARAAGLATLQAFLERGFNAFRQMGGAREFLATIAERETAIVERLFAGEPRPFDLEEVR
jgi:hypothetical protein